MSSFSSSLAHAVRTHPRASAGASFAIVSGATAYVSWTGQHHSAWILWLCAAVALSHAVAAAGVAPRLVQRGVDGSGAFAAGAIASLIALVLFVPGFTWWIASSGTGSRSLLASVGFVILVAVTTFAAEWWALMLICGMLGAVLNRIARLNA